jgi:hypothetical protein
MGAVAAGMPSVEAAEDSVAELSVEDSAVGTADTAAMVSVAAMGTVAMAADGDGAAADGESDWDLDGAGRGTAIMAIPTPTDIPITAVTTIPIIPIRTLTRRILTTTAHRRNSINTRNILSNTDNRNTVRRRA